MCENCNKNKICQIIRLGCTGHHLEKNDKIVSGKVIKIKLCKSCWIFFTKFVNEFKLSLIVDQLNHYSPLFQNY
ncbi:hypothetical protein SATRI_v1c01860 [Spiroplasma atrichopogonis]|nr:hypothetical protein SATRI_v1c01860 [Spiroplasma atrichopogonis]